MISNQLHNRALGYLWVAGSLLGILTILLPDPRGAGTHVVVALSAVTAVWGSRRAAALHAADAAALMAAGRAALSYQADLPVDVVKVDRSFIVPPGTDPRRDALVEAVLRMAGALGLGGIAEGVESTEQADRLTGLGCRHAQGRLFGRSQSAADLEPLLCERRRQIALHGLPAQLTRTSD